MQSYQGSEEAIDTALHVAVDDARQGRSDQLASIMRAHNQRMYRIARSILRNDTEAEDVVQDAFVKAFIELESLRDFGNVGAWLAKITANLAISRVRQLKRREQALAADVRLDDFRMEQTRHDTGAAQLTPERLAAMADIRKLLEQEVDGLADGFREVFMLRVVEQMSVAETADILDIKPETVKTRLHRAKVVLRAGLQDYLTAVSTTAFPFGGSRCARTTAAVLARLQGQAVLPTEDLRH